MFKHKSTSGSNCFVTFILPEGALFVYQLFAEQSIILNLKQKRNPVSTKFLFCYLTEFCPSLHNRKRSEYFSVFTYLHKKNANKASYKKSYHHRNKIAPYKIYWFNPRNTGIGCNTKCPGS